MHVHVDTQPAQMADQEVDMHPATAVHVGRILPAQERNGHGPRPSTSNSILFMPRTYRDDPGLGGALTLDGVPARGRRGFAGEYGHLPFGRSDHACRCGLRGCWQTEADQLALARAADLGRELGVLITVHDPDLVVLSGHTAHLLAAAPQVVAAAAVAGALPAHRSDPPPIEASDLGENSALIGAAEAVFDQLIDEVVPLGEPWGIA
jgi:predicted NBD/HSP70 family sugar kinase